MSPRYVLWLALAISLLFNLFFLAGYLQARSGATTLPSDDASGGSAVVQRVASELGLNDAQADLFGRLRTSMREDDRVYDEALTLVRQELMQALGAESPDIDRIRLLVEREAELHRERRLAGSMRFSEFVSVLSDEQRQRMSRCFGRRRGGPDRRRVIERFDANGDGELDETERAAARAHFEEERERRRQRWHTERLERFDANGDGELDEAEREEARRWYMQQNGHRGDGDGRRRRRH